MKTLFFGNTASPVFRDNLFETREEALQRRIGPPTEQMRHAIASRRRDGLSPFDLPDVEVVVEL